MASNVYFAKGSISTCLVVVSRVLGTINHMEYSLAQVLHVVTCDHESLRAGGLGCCFDQVELRLIGLPIENSDGTHQNIDVVLL